MNNLIQRSITGILFVVLLIGGILYSPFTFGLLFALITGLSLWEFARLVNSKEDVSVNPFITTITDVLSLLIFCGVSFGFAALFGI